MKPLFVAAAALLAGTSAATAQSIQWRGGSFITALTAPCNADWSVGDYFNTRYRHPGIGGNGNFTGLSFFSNFFGTSYVATGPVGRSFKAVTAGVIGSGLSAFPAGTAKMRFLSRQPATINGRTKSIVIQGQISGFTGIAGCTVTFRSTLGLRS